MPLASIKVQSAVTVWDDVNYKIRRYDDPRSVESFVVDPDHLVAKYRYKDRDSLWSKRNRSLYVPPGLMVSVCPKKSKEHCVHYANQGVRRLPRRFFDRKIDLRVYPAVTLFAGEDYDDQGKATQSWRVHKKPLRADVDPQARQANHVGSVILGPNLVLHLCTDEALQDCYRLESGPYGTRAPSIPSPYHEKAHYLHLESKPEALRTKTPHSTPLWHRRAMTADDKDLKIPAPVVEDP